jgi:hypothetical protein
MLTIIIRDDGEKNVVALTYENLFKELKNIPDAHIVVSSDWISGLEGVDTRYVCFVESDCLVNSGYFDSQIGLFAKNPYFRKLAALSSATGVVNWSERFFGYSLGKSYADGIKPVKEKKSSSVYPIQIAYIPGSILRTNMLKEALRTEKINNTKGIDLVELSVKLSLAFWQQGDGNRVHINPNATYLTTESSVTETNHTKNSGEKLHDVFHKEMI